MELFLCLKGRGRKRGDSEGGCLGGVVIGNVGNGKIEVVLKGG